MTAAALAEFKRSLREILPDPNQGIFAVLSALKKVLPEQTLKYNAVFQLETRLNALNKDRIRGLLSQADLDLAYNRITADTLDLIDGLLPADFDFKTAESSVEDKEGSILYRIPRTMEVEEDYKCVVRLAFDLDTVVRNIELTQDTVVKNIRVSEVMEVELVDPNATPSFSIRRLNSVEQFLEKNDYTEWTFFVRPLVTGILPIVLKVSVKEIINERERIKELVLEETIHVVAEPAPADEGAPFQHSGYTVSPSSKGTAEGAAKSALPPQPAPAVPRVSRSRVPKTLLLALGLIVFSGLLASVGMMLGHIPVPAWISGEDPAEADRIFWEKTLKMHTRSSFETYLLAYPEGLFTDMAHRKIDSLKQLDAQKPAPPPVQTAPLTAKPTPAPGKPKNNAPPGAKPKPEDTSSEKPAPSEPPKKQEPKVEAPPVTPPPPTKSRKSGFDMVSVPAGTLAVDKGDCPQGSTVQIQPFRIGKYEITQRDWWEIMGKDPSFHSNCPDCPVERVSWNDIQAFVQKASAAKGKKYRLPYEAEWEWAARGGPQSRNSVYAGSNNPNAVAWFNIVQENTREVGTKQPNELGIYDMSGNVREWCAGRYPPYLSCADRESQKKGIRGGSWADDRNDLRIRSRSAEKPGHSDRRTGLRLVEE
jgi:formylglycine-generating enzyme required for sulfatase activity